MLLIIGPRCCRTTLCSTYTTRCQVVTRRTHWHASLFINISPHAPLPLFSHYHVHLLKTLQLFIFLIKPLPLFSLFLEIRLQKLLHLPLLARHIVLHELPLRASIKLIQVDLLFLIKAIQFKQPLKKHLMGWFLVFALVQQDFHE